jgi:hypothetical protein
MLFDVWRASRHGTWRPHIRKIQMDRATVAPAIAPRIDPNGGPLSSPPASAPIATQDVTEEAITSASRFSIQSFGYSHADEQCYACNHQAYAGYDLYGVWQLNWEEASAEQN